MARMAGKALGDLNDFRHSSRLRKMSEVWEPVSRARQVKRLGKGLVFFAKHVWSRLRGGEHRWSTVMHVTHLCVYMCV